MMLFWNAVWFIKIQNGVVIENFDLYWNINNYPLYIFLNFVREHLGPVDDIDLRNIFYFDGLRTSHFNLFHHSSFGEQSLRSFRLMNYISLSIFNFGKKHKAIINMFIGGVYEIFVILQRITANDITLPYGSIECIRHFVTWTNMILQNVSKRRPVQGQLKVF